MNLTRIQELLTIFLFVNKISYADTWYYGHVIAIDPSQMPNTITFTTDTSAGPCATGTWLAFSSTFLGTSTDNVKAIYTALISAQATGNKVEFDISPSATATNCNIIGLGLFNTP